MVLLVLVMLASPPGPWQVDAPALEAADRVIAGSMLPSDEVRQLIARNVYASLRYLRWGVQQTGPQAILPLRHQTPLLNALNELVLLPQAQRLALSDAQIEALWGSHGVAAEDALAIVGYPANPEKLASLTRKANRVAGTSAIGYYLRDFDSIPNATLIEQACKLPFSDHLSLLFIDRRAFAFDALVEALPTIEKALARHTYWSGCYKSAVRAMMATNDSRLEYFDMDRLDPRAFLRVQSQPVSPEFPWVEFSFMQWEMQPTPIGRGPRRSGRVEGSTPSMR